MLQLLVEELMPYYDVRFVFIASCFRCMFVNSGVQHILCCGFVLFCFASSMLPVSLDCPILIAPSVFSNVYFHPKGIYIYIYIHTCFLDVLLWIGTLTLGSDTQVINPIGFSR